MGQFLLTDMGLKSLLVTLSVSVAATVALPQTAKVPPLEAKLSRSLDARALKAGDELLFTANADWSSGTCHLASGAAIHATIVAVQTGPGAKHEQIALTFWNPCDTSGGSKLFWLALLGPEDAALKGVQERSTVVQAFRSPTFGEGGSTSSGTSKTGDSTLSGRDSPNFPLFSGSSEAAPEPRPQFIRPGQVWHLPHLTLQPAGGPAESTKLSSTSGRLRLPAGSVFVLVGDPRVERRTLSNPVSSPLAKVARPAVPALAVCHSPACSLAAFGEQRSARPTLTLTLADTGYKPLAKAELTQLNYDAALSFLSENQLLLVFHSRALMQRDLRDQPEDHPHMVSAVVFDLPNGEIHQRQSFRVQDDKQFLWPLPDGRVLLHVENSLRWLGANLHEERVLPLHGPLAFLRLSPDGSHYAVGVTEEMHQAAEHQALSASDASGPEERVRVRILDSGLSVIDEEVASSRLLPPTLVNDGTIQIRHLPSGEFYLQHQSWHRESHREFARVASTCIPHLESAAPDLLALETCTRSASTDRSLS